MVCIRRSSARCRYCNGSGECNANESYGRAAKRDRNRRRHAVLYFYTADRTAPEVVGTNQYRHIEGDDETYLNGTRIGYTEGWGVADFGTPRMYVAGPKALRAGENVLAVRITSWRNQATFGIKRPPLTFAFCVTNVTQPPGKPLGQTLISADAARRAIFEADPELTSTERLQRKRPGFGRFVSLFSMACRRWRKSARRGSPRDAALR